MEGEEEGRGRREEWREGKKEGVEGGGGERRSGRGGGRGGEEGGGGGGGRKGGVEGVYGWKWKVQANVEALSCSEIKKIKKSRKRNKNEN